MTKTKITAFLLVLLDAACASPQPPMSMVRYTGQYTHRFGRSGELSGSRSQVFHLSECSDLMWNDFMQSWVVLRFYGGDAPTAEVSMGGARSASDLPA